MKLISQFADCQNLSIDDYEANKNTKIAFFIEISKFKISLFTNYYVASGNVRTTKLDKTDSGNLIISCSLQTR